MKDRLAPEEKIAAHRHVSAYASYVVSGDYEERSIDGVFRCDAGYFIVHPPMHCHSNFAGGHGAVIENITLPHTALSLDDYICVDANQHARAIDEFLSRQCPEALGELKRHDLRSLSKVNGPAWIGKIATDLRDDAEERKSIQQYGADFKISAAYISRRFKRAYGVGPAAFKREHQLRRAIDLLRAGGKPADVAFASGFADHSHLCRETKRYVGLTPSEIRRQVERVL